jgi:hypothetical protein
MDTSKHTLATLFEQLGMDGDAASIEAFVSAHRPIPEATMLADAAFWSTGQAALLREAIAEDSDWAEPVDELDALLRAH